jgi:hypothetical protein
LDVARPASAREYVCSGGVPGSAECESAVTWEYEGGWREGVGLVVMAGRGRGGATVGAAERPGGW